MDQNSQGAGAGSKDLAQGGHDFGIVPGLLWAFRFDPEGHSDSLPVEAPIENPHGGWLWLHVNLSDARIGDWLATLDLPEAARAFLSVRATHQQLLMSDGCIYGVMSDLLRNFDKSDDVVTHLYFAMTERVLVSGRHHAATGAANVRQALEEGRARIQSVARLLELIVEKLAEGVDGYLDEVADSLDAIEESVSRGARDDRRQDLGRIRRASVKLHRELTGLRSIFRRLEEDGVDGQPPPLQIAAHKLTQRLDALDHDVMSMRDRARLLQEEINALTAEDSNRALNLVSALSVIFLPPTLVTGVYGMNIKGLPFGDDPNGFLWVSAIMIVSTLAVWWLMRWIGVVKR
jgi:zinc transporter